MTGKTIPEIQAEHGQRASEILSSYHADIDWIKAEREPDAGAYLDRLSDNQRAALLDEQKHEWATSAHERARSDYTAEVERYHEDISRRSLWLKERLFKVIGSDGAAALSRTVTATDGELETYLDVALQADNTDLARAVFVAVERRGSGDLMARFFEEVDGEARELYHEFKEPPPSEVLERQREGIDRILPAPEVGSLNVTARSGY